MIIAEEGHVGGGGASQEREGEGGRVSLKQLYFPWLLVSDKLLYHLLAKIMLNDA